VELAAGWRKATLSIRPNLSCRALSFPSSSWVVSPSSTPPPPRRRKKKGEKGDGVSTVYAPPPSPSPAPPVRTFAGLEPRGLTGRDDARAAEEGWSRWKRDLHAPAKNSCCRRWCLFVLCPSPESRVPRQGGPRPDRLVFFSVPALFVPDATAYGTDSARNDSLRRDGVHAFSTKTRPPGPTEQNGPSGLNLSSSLPSVFLEAPHRLIVRG
jgi:hypothetical protein